MGITELRDEMSWYLDSESISLVSDAYLLAAQAHSGQTRMTGEAYIYHPLAVARILVGLRMDAYTICAAVLHDVIEDTDVSKEVLTKRFGETVAELVDGVSKLDKIRFSSVEAAAAASFRKLMLAMTRDIRVMLIKLADRLHNMRTLNVMRPDKRRRIARETLEVYAPIALRLGISSLCVELEDLGFKALHPMRYKVLENHVSRTRKHRKEIMTAAEIAFTARMDAAKIDGGIVAREKHLYSIYLKMKERKKRITDIMDIFALRVITNSVDDCYRMLGVAHSIYKPLPGFFKDYIAIPKSNGYQGLHTILFGPQGVPIELQIRTKEMNQFAESGIAAHWIYKEGESPQLTAQNRAQRWVQDVLQLQQKSGNSIDFLEAVKIDLYPNDIYVFTPKGKIMELPIRATPVDFAYAVHTDLGHECSGALVNGKMVPLSTTLHNGQTVTIMRNEGARPNPSWLNFVVTAKARAGIRHFLKNMKDTDGIRLGRRLLVQALNLYAVKIQDIPNKTWKVILEEYGYKNKQQLFSALGYGKRVPSLVARRIAPLDQASLSKKLEGEGSRLPSITKLDIKGTEGLVILYAKCCHPIPGDHIVAVISASKGLVVHRARCKNMPDMEKSNSVMFGVDWDDNVDTMFPVKIRVETKNRRGVLALLSNAITDIDCDIEHIQFIEKDGVSALLIFTLTVQGRDTLAKVFRRLKNLNIVDKVSRQKG